VTEGVEVNFLEVIEGKVKPLQVRHISESIPGGVGEAVVTQGQVCKGTLNWPEETVADLMEPKF
jgi:hypothetical protein